MIIARAVILALASATLASAVASAVYWFRSAALQPYSAEEPMASMETLREIIYWRTP
jgi:hypothetical protein